MEDLSICGNFSFHVWPQDEEEAFISSTMGNFFRSYRWGHQEV